MRGCKSHSCLHMTKKRRIWCLVALCAWFLVLCIGYGLGCVGVFWLPDAWKWWAFAGGNVVFLGGVLVFLGGFWGCSEYVCGECGTRFRPKFWAWCLAMHSPTSRYMKCPNDGKFHWCKNAIFVKGETPTTGVK